MTQTIMTVTYRLAEVTQQDDARALKQEFAAAAPVIAATPGLNWKISAIDAERGAGLGLYLFETAAAARGFAVGELMYSLRSHPGIADVHVITAPVVRDLSLETGAAAALGLASPRSEPAAPAAAVPAKI